jgi:hypothetical protein
MNIHRSTVHSPRIDDEMAAETESLTRGAPVESHAEEWRSQESPADDEPEVESIIELTRDRRGSEAASAAGAPGELDPNEVRRRSELAAALPGHAFPGDRGVLLHAAEAEHAPEWVIDALGTLPIDTRFDTPQDVWSALGGHRETRATADTASAPADDVDHVDEPAAAPPRPAAERAPEPSPSPPPGLDLLARVAGLAGLGVEVASAVVGGTVQLARRVLGSLRR